MATIIYTHTDEAPDAGHLLVPARSSRRSPRTAGVDVETRDISLGRPDPRRASRSASPRSSASTTPSPSSASWPRRPRPTSSSCRTSRASMPAAQGRDRRAPGAGLRTCPTTPTSPRTDEERDIRARYDKVKGSAVNPVLREGNSDRRAPAVGQELRPQAPALDGRVERRLARPTSRTMGRRRLPLQREVGGHRRPTTPCTIEHVDDDGTDTVLKDGLAGAGRRGRRRHRHARRRARGVPRGADRPGQGRGRAVLGAPQGHDDEGLRPDHLRPRRQGLLRRASSRATATTSPRPACRPNNGLGGHPRRPRRAPRRRRRSRPPSSRASPTAPRSRWSTPTRASPTCTCPSDVIVDASMPAMIRTSGHMWDPDGDEHDTLAVIPDSCYAGIYQVVIDDCRDARRLRPDHDGLGPQRRPDGPGGRGVRQPRQDLRDPPRPAPSQVVDDGRQRRARARRSSAGDIWRACQTKDAPIRDWVKLAVTRARAIGDPGGLLARRDPRPRRQPDRQGRGLPARARHRGPRHRIMSPVEADDATPLERIRQGEDTISVTGNVLRDYLTDLFPILELGTSAKMLSVVPLMNGGGLFETGAGGSAPKHVQQLVKENYLRWDSLGEFLALAESLRAPDGERPTTPGPRSSATPSTGPPSTLLDENKSPAPQGRRDRQPRQPLLPGAVLGRGAGAPDRGRRRWPRAFAARGPAARRRERGDHRRRAASPSRAQPVDIGGYYRPDADKAAAVMRPSGTFNRILDGLTR